MKKSLIAISMVLAFAGVSFGADAATPGAEKPGVEAAAPAKKEKKAAKKATKKSLKKAPVAEKKAAE